MHGPNLVSRRHVLALAALAAAGDGTRRAATATPSRPVVVELFTSQACSSCPPADAFMQELRSASGVLALSFHVDYWDYLGWRDTLADSAYSDRQRGYAESRGDADIYTPQIVIDGTNHFVGSDRPSVRAAIERARAVMPSSLVPLSLSRNGHEFMLTAASMVDGPESHLWLIAIAPAIAVKITRGENAGREIVYYNVVRRITPAGMWHGKSVSVNFPVDGVMTADSKACVALLQARGIGPVIGAAAWGEINHDA
jgi:hypothetical protein